MNKKVLTLVLTSIISVGCSTQTKPPEVTVLSSTNDLRDLYLKHPIKAPKERSYKEFMKVLNVAMFKECIVTKYLGIKVPDYCSNK